MKSEFAVKRELSFTEKNFTAIDERINNSYEKFKRL